MMSEVEKRAVKFLDIELDENKENSPWAMIAIITGIFNSLWEDDKK